MTLKQKFDSIDQSKLNADQKAFLGKMEKATNSFKSENKEVNDKIEAGLDKMIAVFKEKMPEAIKSEPKKEAKTKKEAKPKKEAKAKDKKEEKEEKSEPKRTVMSLAKEIRKEGETWTSAQNRAKDIIQKDKEEANEVVKSEMDKLRAFIKTRVELEGIHGTDLPRDSTRTALRKGRRISKNGKIYYENRDNRTDRLAPNYPENAPLLEAGGNLGYDLAGHLGGDFNVGQNNGALSGFSNVQYTGLVGETGAMSSGEMFEKGGEIDAFTIRMVKGSSDNSREIITEDKKVSFAKGGDLSQYSSFIQEEFPANKREANKQAKKNNAEYLVVIENGNDDKIAMRSASYFNSFPKAYQDKHTILYSTKSGFPKESSDKESSAKHTDFFMFEKIIKDSKSEEDAFNKARNLKGVSIKVSEAFRKKYDPKQELTPRQAFHKFYKEIKSKQKTGTREGYLEKIGYKEAEVWDKIGAESGGDIRADKKLLRKYAELVEEMLQEEGVGKGSFDKSDYDYFTNENWHLFNDFLVWNGYFELETTKEEKKWRKEKFESGSIYVSDPKIITISNFGSGYVTIIKNASKQYQIEILKDNGDFHSFKDRFSLNELDKAEKLAKEIAKNNKVKYLGVDSTPYDSVHSKKYIPNAEIKSITVKEDGKEKEIDGILVLNGANIFDKGGNISKIAKYYAKRNIVSVKLKNGEEINPRNGYWVMKNPKMSRTQFEDESFEYEEGGSLESLAKSKGYEYPIEVFFEADGKTYEVIQAQKGLKKIGIFYKTEDIESLPKSLLNNISSSFGKDFEITFYTNAGVDLHSKEKGVYKNIKIEKVPYSKLEKGGVVIKNKHSDFGKDHDAFENYVMDRISLDERREIRKDWEKEKNKTKWEDYLLTRVNEMKHKEVVEPKAKSKSGSKRGNGEIFLFAKKIRKDGEAWGDALKRAGAEFRKK